jgi:hypothetical protein
MGAPRRSLHAVLAVLALAASSLAACGGGAPPPPAVSSARVTGPDGQNNWIAIVCKGAQMRCVQRAGEECPKGYTIAEQHAHEGQSSASSASASGTSTQFGGSFGARGESSSWHTYTGELLVKCKTTDIPPGDPRRSRECMSNVECVEGDECVFPAGAAWDTPGRCAPR